MSHGVSNPTQAEWWWQYGLDGIVGGVIGGAVAGLALFLTIRHERSLARAADLRAALRSALLTAAVLRDKLERGELRRRAAETMFGEVQRATVEATFVTSPRTDWRLGWRLRQHAESFSDMHDCKLSAMKAEGWVLCRDFTDEMSTWLTDGPRAHLQFLKNQTWPDPEAIRGRGFWVRVGERVSDVRARLWELTHRDDLDDLDDEVVGIGDLDDDIESADEDELDQVDVWDDLDEDKKYDRFRKTYSSRIRSWFKDRWRSTEVARVNWGARLRRF